MARGSFDPEIKQSIEKPAPRKSVPQRRPGGNRAAPAQKADSPAELAADKSAGIAPNSPQDMAMDAKLSGGSLPQAGNPVQQGHSPAHAAMAASIAHAILQRGGG